MGNGLVAKLATSSLGNASLRTLPPRPVTVKGASSVLHGAARSSALGKSRELVSILARNSMRSCNFSNSIQPRLMN